MPYKGFGGGMHSCPKCGQIHYLPDHRIGENLYLCDKCGAKFRIATKKVEIPTTELV